MSTAERTPDKRDHATREAASTERRGYDLLVPRGWASLPTDPDEAAPAIRRVVDRVLRGQPRDELVHVRIGHERALRDLVEQARAQGGQTVHVLIEPIGDAPVSASLVVARHALVEGLPPSELIRALDDGDGVVEHGRVELGPFGALRRRRRTQGAIDGSSGGEAGQVWRTSVEYVVDVGADGLLLLTFSTVTDPLADAMVALFDAVAASLRVRTLSD